MIVLGAILAVLFALELTIGVLITILIRSYGVYRDFIYSA